MTRALRAAMAVALLAAAVPTPAYVRSTTEAGQPARGLCLYWGARQVRFVVNATSATPAPCGSAAAATTLTAASFPAWSPACTDFGFVNGGTTAVTAVANDGTNLVVFRSGLCQAAGCSGNACASTHNCWDHDAMGTIALTTTTFVASTGQILDADMEIHGWNGLSRPQATGSYLTCATPSSPPCTAIPYGQTGCNFTDVGNVVTHEAGHMLGLEHTCVASYPAPYNYCPNAPDGTTMDPTMQPGETRKRVLTADDVAGVCAIYPLNAATVTCSSPSSSSGCGTAGGGTGSLGLLALGFLILRRRSSRRA